MSSPRSPPARRPLLPPRSPPPTLLSLAHQPLTHASPQHTLTINTQHSPNTPATHTHNPHKTDGLVVCHLPYGPTAYFGVANAVLRHDIGQKREVGTIRCD